MRSDDLLERLRAANPARTIPHGAVDHEQLLSRAQDARRPEPQARRRRAGWPAALAGLLLALGVAGGALAASGVDLPLLSGDPPLRGTAPSSVRVLGVRVADPAGGLPWALRAYRTDRGDGCLEIGRIRASRFDRASEVVGCSRPNPQAPGPSSDPYSGTMEATVDLDGKPVAETNTDGRPNPRSPLRTVAYGTPNGLDSAYLVVLAGNVPSHRLRTIQPCERQVGRLVAAVANRCPR